MIIFCLRKYNIHPSSLCRGISVDTINLTVLKSIHPWCQWWENVFYNVHSVFTFNMLCQKVQVAGVEFNCQFLFSLVIWFNNLIVSLVPSPMILLPWSGFQLSVSCLSSTCRSSFQKNEINSHLISRQYFVLQKAIIMQYFNLNTIFSNIFQYVFLCY